MEIQLLSKLLVSFVFVGVLGLFFRVYNAVVAEPGRLRSTLRKQGLRGPLPTFLLGNILDMKKARDVAAKAGTVNGPPDSHNCGAALLPFFDEWRKKYGDVFLFSLGNTQIVHVTQPEMVREITTCTSLDLGKPTYQAKERGSLLGQGILTSNGPIWAHQRKILAPELYMDKVKGMISLIQDSTITLLNSWRNIVEREGGLADINIDKYMRSFSGDVISRACFGSNYSKGEEIFLKLRALQEAASKSFGHRDSRHEGMISLIQDSTVVLLNSWRNIVEREGGLADINIDQDLRSFSGDVISRACFGSNYSKGEAIFLKLRALQEAASKKGFALGIPGMRHLPTKGNREAWALEKDIRTLILNVVKERQEAGYEKDLLQMLLEGAKNSDLSSDMLDKFIVDNCKNIYLAGYETTAVSATWCLMLLASNPKWQERVRAEVLEVCKGQTVDYDMIRKMKQLTMVINESLRLYPPVTVVSREAFKDMKFGNIDVPKGMNVWTYVLTSHTDPEIWGPDAYEFNPERFANGITGACKFPHLYMPFGVGPRVCLGQNLALVELKVLIALILSNFSFTLSPSYVHSPALSLVIEPGHGVNLYVKKL
ncbi:UNVERIFIED_CONTAM: cytochrome [Sesamum calycinum]|uniref:Cytochrome n=1 Tax=Sesamum calycinum TaxID=2727403 RepID=A0AAW2S9J7_9LAMI